MAKAQLTYKEKRGGQFKLFAMYTTDLPTYTARDHAVRDARNYALANLKMGYAVTKYRVIDRENKEEFKIG